MTGYKSDPVLVSIKGMKPRYEFGRTKTYELINKGLIETRRVGGRVFVVDASVKRMLGLEEAA